jgi:hypothetical protein
MSLLVPDADSHLALRRSSSHPGGQQFWQSELIAATIGSNGSIIFGADFPAAPYFVVAPGDPNFCENEGAYPAVDRGTGAVYVAYEHDWFSGLFNCGGETTQNVMNYIPSPRWKLHSSLAITASR